MLLSQLLITLGFASAALGSSYRPDSKLAKNVLEETKEGYYCSPSGPIESTHCLYETVEILNSDLYPVLQKLVDFPFFRHYKVDLFRECPFWYENGFCMNRACGVEAANEDDIPEKWRTQSLSAVRKSGDISGGVSGCYFREQDFCYIEDDATPDGEYIDLGLNPERFTGYAGDSAHQVWRAIYEENCFGLSEAAISATKAPTSKSAASAMVGGVGMMGGSSQNAFGFAKLNEGWGTEMAKHAEVDMCEEKKVYYRIISGLHASISIHICQEYLDQQTGEWSPNLDCFVSRLGAHPERLSNVYFNAVLLLRAIARAAPYLEAYDIATAPPLPAKALQATLDPSVQRKRARDEEAKDTLGQVLRMAEGRGISRGFDEEAFFTGPDAVVLKEQFKTHFRNVSRIMDCVGCDKCRLWGKLQVSGIGTALKILFELDEKALDPKVNPDLLQRSEVVALFNTLHRISESLAAVEDFRKLYRDTQKAAKLEAASSASSAAAAASTRTATTGKRRPKKPATLLGARVVPSADGLTDRQHGWRAAAVAVVYAAYETLWKGCRGCWGAVERVLGGVAGTAGGKGEL